jgi:hypothetical protein
MDSHISIDNPLKFPIVVKELILFDENENGRITRLCLTFIKKRNLFTYS